MALLIVAPTTVSGSTISYMAPTEPFSSPNRTVPHGVTRTGSQLLSPVAMVVASPFERLIFCRAGCATPSSLQAMMTCGFDCGQSTIWSRFGAAFPAVTTLTSSPFATEIRSAGWASAWARSRSTVEDASSGWPTPNSG